MKTHKKIKIKKIKNSLACQISQPVTYPEMLGLRVGGEWRLQIHNDTDFVLDRYFVYQISVH